MSSFRRILAIFIATSFVLVGISLPISAEVSVSVSAHSAVLIEASTGNIIYQKNAFEKRSMASTTKIMTAIVALEYGDLAKTVEVSSKAVGIEGSSIYLKAGEKLTIRELVYAVMLESANDAAAAVAIAIAGSIEDFAVLMNKKAEEIGMKDSHFTNPHGLDHKDHYTTAYDLAILARHALKNDLFREISSTKKTTIPNGINSTVRYISNHNKMLRLYDGAIGVKTGFTKKSGRCLVSAAERGGLRLIAVTLNAPSDWNDHTRMLDLGFSKYEAHTLCGYRELNIMLPVVGGDMEQVVCSNNEPLSIVLPKGNNNITRVVEMPTFMYAPVAENQVVGSVLYYNNGELIAKCDIVALNNIEKIEEKPGPFDWITKIFTHR